MGLLDGIAQHLDSLGLVTFDPTGTTGDCFIETMPDSPDEAVGVYGYGGPEADAKLGYDEPSLQVRVRGGPDPRTSRGRAQDIYDALHGLSNVTLPDGTVLVGCIGVQSSPQSLGPDPNRRHEHVVNFRTEVRNLAGGRV